MCWRVSISIIVAIGRSLWAVLPMASIDNSPSVACWRFWRWEDNSCLTVLSISASASGSPSAKVRRGAKREFLLVFSAISSAFSAISSVSNDASSAISLVFSAISSVSDAASSNPRISFSFSVLNGLKRQSSKPASFNSLMMLASWAVIATTFMWLWLMC